MKPRSIITLLLAAAMHSAFSQSTDFTGIKKMNMRNIAAMVQNSTVVGYYAFYGLDKASSSENEYGLEIMDNNLKVTHSIRMKKSNKSTLLEAAYNGDYFCFSFVDIKKKTLEFQLYSKEGIAAKSYIVSGLSDNEINFYASSMQSDEDNFNGWLYGVPGKGFIRCGMEKENGYRILVEMFSNDAKKQWTASSGATTKKSFESLSPLFVNENYFITTLNVRDGLMAQDGTTFVVGYDISTGNEVFRVDSKHEKGYLMPLGASVEGDEVIVYGEYYGFRGKEKNKLDLGNKIGFYAQIVDKDGNVKRENFSSWAQDVAKLVPLNSKGRMDNNTSIMIHKFVKTSSGNYFAIGEQFKKAVDVAGAFTGTASAKLELYDMMVFEFDNNLVLSKVTVFDKEKTNVILPRGAGVNGTASLGYLAKMMGWFDYVFTTQSSDKSTFNSVYVNYDKTVDEGSKYTIGNIALTKEQKLVNAKVNLKTKPTSFVALPAKPGYITIFEYFKKKKTGSIHLEKLDI